MDEIELSESSERREERENLVGLSFKSTHVESDVEDIPGHYDLEILGLLARGA